MQITNKELLPRLMVHAVSHDRYEPGHGDISCTTLIAPAQIRVLKKQHEGELVEDAAMRVWSIIGSASHYVLENAVIHMKQEGEWDESNLVEERFYHEVNGKVVSAQIDLFETGDLYDFKVTSVWTIKDAIENGKFEWDAQLNIQRYLMEKNDATVNNIYIIAIARDWNKSGSLRDRDYPPRVVKLEIPMWSMDKTEEYIQSRLNAHYSDITPECTPKECWEKPTKYALMKKGRQSALRLQDSWEAIMDYADGKKLVEYQSTLPDGEPEPQLAKDHYIEVRQGERTRCAFYCDVADFCDQYQQWREDNAPDKE